MNRFLRLFSVVCFLSSVVAYATEPAVSPVERLTDLGQGLSYLRIHALADSEKALQSALPGAGALVLDLRYATAGDEPIDALRAVLAGRAGANQLLLVLVGPATPAKVAQVITEAAPVLTLGITGATPVPRITVKADPATDRRAYEALETGTPIAALIKGKIEKERFDEATLVHEFKNGNPDAEPPPPPDPTANKAAPAPEQPAPLLDVVLQRAVHLHRALLALRR